MGARLQKFDGVAAAGIGRSSASDEQRFITTEQIRLFYRASSRTPYALYILLVAFNNITDFGTNQAFVQHVFAMDTTNFGGKPGTNPSGSEGAAQ